jgi:N-acetyl-gamma-glutamyl-phosphate reductase
MVKPKIFIDGEHGTTGLQIRERLALRSDIEQLTIPHAERHSIERRTEMLRAADIAILCLPDDASRESVALAEGSGTRFIDASSAFRTAADWAFGFPELTKDQPAGIAKAQYVSNPGCYSTGAIALLRPLIDAGILPLDYPVTINAVSGYSGGGKQLIAQMEEATRADAISAHLFAYALSLQHKHVAEIITRSGLTRRPIFTPNVGRFAQGMLVNVPLHLGLLNGSQTASTIHAALAAHYAGQSVVQVLAMDVTVGMVRLDPEALNGTNLMKLYVFGDASTGHVNLVAQLDNLGKGASGAAVQNLDLMLATQAATGNR